MWPDGPSSARTARTAGADFGYGERESRPLCVQALDADRGDRVRAQPVLGAGNGQHAVAYQDAPGRHRVPALTGPQRSHASTGSASAPAYCTPSCGQHATSPAAPGDSSPISPGTGRCSAPPTSGT